MLFEFPSRPGRHLTQRQTEVCRISAGRWLKISRVFARRIVRKRQSLTCDEVIRHDVWFGEIRRRAFTGKRFELFYKMRLIVIAAIERGLHEIPVVLSSLEHS